MRFITPTIFLLTGIYHVINIGLAQLVNVNQHPPAFFLGYWIVNQKEHMPRGKGTVESCTLCVHRVDKGGVPACAEAVSGEG
jgi:hypothetical protein